jgi:ATP/maltotriose-dependent transcriptional regulator MalT
VLIWKGDWKTAEAELTTARKDLERSRPAMLSGALARLADLRRRQGRFDEALRLYDEASSHPTTPIGRAQIMLERADARGCVTELRGFLLDIGNTEATARVAALEVLARAEAAVGDVAGARRALAELHQIAKDIGTRPVEASALFAEGIILDAEGDAEGAAHTVERAVRAFQESSAPFETAAARLTLAEILARAGKTADAKGEADKALAAARSLGAEHQVARATTLIQSLESSRTRSRSPGELTARQLEILRLVAKGESNPEIAKRLRLSQHTVKRHVANLLTRLGLPSRAAAAAYAAREGLV